MLFARDVSFLIIYAVGGALCLLQWQRQPRRSRIAFIAFVLLFIRALVSALTNWLIYRSVIFAAYPAISLFYLLELIEGLSTFSGVLAWILLLVAFFGIHDRTAPSESAADERPTGGLSETGIQQRPTR
jgi:uncharacterized membrane protein